MNNKIIVALTGATGSMGSEALHQIMASSDVLVRLLVLNDKRNIKIAKKYQKLYKDNIDVVYGDIASYDDCVALIKDASFIFHCAAMIPPASDHYQEKAKLVNYQGTKNIVNAIRNSGREDEIYLVYVSTVALYGNRNYKHMWGRVGDPLLVSPYDYYALYKLWSERYLLDANLKHFVSLRETGILHKDMFKNNMNDGLMFHTAWNSPLEWVTDKDSGRLLANLLIKSLDNSLDKDFWNKVYNIGGLEGGRVTGYETIDSGYALMGSTAKKFFKPNYNIDRNFHGIWYTDSHILNDYLDFVKEDSKIYWKRMAKKYWYFKLGAIIPSSILSKLVIQKLFNNANSPYYWIKHNFQGRIDAFYGSLKNFHKIGTSWETYPLLCESKSQEGYINYQELLEPKNAILLDHGYDENKLDSELDINDMKKAAIFRGGLCLSDTMTKGDLFSPLKWRCSEGHTFMASPYTILKAGHWCIDCLSDEKWKFDLLSTKNPFYAQVWYDSHDKSEINRVYPYNEEEIRALDYD